MFNQKLKRRHQNFSFGQKQNYILDLSGYLFFTEQCPKLSWNFTLYLK